ncbi:MAG: LSU ribosomal protein L31p @ LSU ribosomal protein L31p, zinc-independent, partial [uncultured Rubellimicrobium sp.]
EVRHPSRIPSHRRAHDRWHRGPDEDHLGQGRRHDEPRDRPAVAPGLDRRRHAHPRHRGPRLQVQEQVRGPGLL